MLKEQNQKASFKVRQPREGLMLGDLKAAGEPRSHRRPVPSNQARPQGPQPSPTQTAPLGSEVRQPPLRKPRAAQADRKASRRESQSVPRKRKGRWHWIDLLAGGQGHSLRRSTSLPRTPGPDTYMVTRLESRRESPLPPRGPSQGERLPRWPLPSPGTHTVNSELLLRKDSSLL